jgi:hypothetical protein
VVGDPGRHRLIGGVPIALIVSLALGGSAAEAADPPQIASAWASEIAATSVRLEGIVDPGGLSTTYRFDYITELAFGTNLSGGREAFDGAARAPAGPEGSIEAGAGPVAVSRLLVGLPPETGYRYRLVAHNAAGTAASETLSFVTQPPTPIVCEGDACQILPPEPVDPTLTTLIPGPGNPPVHYRKLRRHRVRRHRRPHRHHHRPHRHGRHRGHGGWR